MGKVSSYRELIVWQKAIVLVKQVYEVTHSFPDEEKFGLISQIRRSAISIPSNIAEGWGRSSSKSFSQFLFIARGSLFELETQLYIAKELGFITDLSSIESLLSEIGKMLNAILSKFKDRE